MREPTLYINGVPVIKHELLKMNTILIMYKSEGKTPAEIIQMKKDKNFRDVDKILYNYESIDDIDLFNKAFQAINNNLTIT